MKEVSKKEEHAVSGGAQAPIRVLDGLVIPIGPVPGPTYPPSPFPNPIERALEK